MGEISDGGRIHGRIDRGNIWAEIPSIDPLVCGEIHIEPISISHTEVNILKFSFFKYMYVH